MGEQKKLQAREIPPMEIKLSRKKLVGERSSPAPLTPRLQQRAKPFTSVGLGKLYIWNYTKGTPSLSYPPWSQEGDILTLEIRVTF